MNAERGLAALVSRLPIRGRESLAYRLFERDRRAEGSWDVRLGDGLTLKLPASSRQTWLTAFTGAYDAPYVELLVSHLRPGTVALDIGASLGLYTVQLAAAARRLGASVVAVEPVPANAAIVRDNLVRNGLEGWATVVDVALGDRSGTLTMSVERGGAGNATVVNGLLTGELVRHSSAGGLETAGAIRVQPLDDLTFDHPVSVVKMDVEGFEMEVLAGAEAFVGEHRPVIYGEFSEEWMASRGRRLDEPFEWARAHDYTVSRVGLRRSGRLLKRTELVVSRMESAARRGPDELLLQPA